MTKIYSMLQMAKKSYGSVRISYTSKSDICLRKSSSFFPSHSWWEGERNGISRECLELLPWSFAWKYLRVSCFKNDTFKKICACRPAQPTYQPKVKKWDNFSNYWPIKLKFGMQVPFTYLHATVTFDNDPSIFLLTNPTYQKVAYSKIFNLPQLEHFL